MKLRFNKINLLIFGIFIIAVLVWTYPALLHFRTKIIGYNDAWQFFWNLWWVKTALLNLHTNPFYTFYLHWPVGISLLFHTLNIVNALIAVPLQGVLGLPATYNLLLVLNLAFNGFATYLLAYYYSKNKFASAVAGLLLAFSPYMVTHALGHLNLITFGWAVLFILYFQKMLNGEKDWKLPTLFLFLTGLSDWYYFFYVLIFVFLRLVFLAIFERKKLRRPLILNLIFNLGGGLLLLSPWLGAMIYLKVATNEFNIISHQPADYSVNATALVVPNVTWYYFKQFFYSFWSRWHWTREGVGYLGYGALVLLMYAAVKIRTKIVYFWIFLVFVFTLLAMGPYLQVNYHVYPKILLPYHYLYEYLPFMSIQGVPARFMVMTYLSLAVIVALAIKDILALKSKWKYLPLVVVLGFATFESLPVKLLSSPVTTPDFYAVLRQEPGDYAIMDLSQKEYLVLYYQTIHHKKLISGYTSRPSQSSLNFLRDTPVVSNIYHSLDFPEPLNIDESRSSLKKYEIKYILIKGNDSKRIELLNKLKLPIAFKNQAMVVYQVY